MKSRLSIVPALQALAVGALFASMPIQAQVVIPISSDVGPVSQGSGSGLNGYYYGNGLAASTPDDASTDSYINAHSPVATFVTTGIAYPSAFTTAGDGNTLSSFLGADAASLSVPAVGSNNLDGQIIHFTGYLAINTAGTYSFELGSDDGSRLNIGGLTVDDLPGDHGFTTQTNTAMFSEAGLYAVDIIYYEHHSVTGVTFASNLTGTPGVVVPDSLLFQQANTAVPEPGSYALFGGLGMTGVFLMRRRTC